MASETNSPDNLALSGYPDTTTGCTPHPESIHILGTDSVTLSAAGKEPDNAPIQRVIDVPLTVTLRFGHRQMTLRELLELNTGSLVELDQQVEEPVHLMLGDRIIARGEVVIVDGNYGMRVLEVVEHPGAGRLSAFSQR